MKSYPYIYSLSTVGLIHHYNNDYIFNRIRTDFTGDSGTGKSMVADLLQLLFVGSTEFEAATESLDEKRKPKGMVLSDRKRGLSGRGYAFLNIALEEHQFLVMGMYLEHSTNYARPFIIFQGYDIEKPDFMDKPLSHKAFLDAQNILPLEVLKTHLLKLHLNCESLQLPAYHRFLYRQQILPFDLADNPAKLRAYALIIQSFSRGKGFKFDTKNLQDFLFGTTWEKDILVSYNQQVENIGASVRDSLNYQKQIAELTEKKIALQNLILLDQRQKHARSCFLNNKYNFLEEQATTIARNISDSFTKRVTIAFDTTYLQRIDTQQQWSDTVKALELTLKYKNEKAGNSNLAEEAADAWRYYTQQKAVMDKLTTITQVVEELGSVETAIAYYTRQNENKAEVSALSAFIGVLIQKEILLNFEDSLWSKDYNAALSNHREKVQKLDAEISELQALLKFTNVNDPLSVANWAISRNKAFTIHEESLLVKYKDLIISQPDDIKERYLPEPSSLFEHLDIDGAITDPNGFWISMMGIYEYVPFVKEQFLNDPDPEVKENYFTKRYDNANIALEKAKEEKEQLCNFYDKLDSISALEGNIILYHRKPELEAFQIIPGLKVDPDEFKMLLSYYNERATIIEEYKSAQLKHKKANETMQAFNDAFLSLSNIKDIDGHITMLHAKEKVQNEDYQWLQRKLSRLSPLLNQEMASLREIALQEQIKQSSLATALSTTMTIESGLKAESINLRSLLKAITLEITHIKNSATDNGFTLANSHPGEKYTEEQINQWEQDSSDLHREYRLATEHLAKNYMADDQYKYTDELDWKKIARGLLPEVFKSADISEEDLSSEIEERLQNIVEKNKVIGDRKVQILLEVFTKVETAFTVFSTEIDKLRSFFSDHDKRITGGHKVVIKSEPSTDYPIQWITEFKKQMREENTNRTGLFKIADDAIDFKDIIVKSFRLCGGKKTEPKVEDLLNPKKYFELNFSLQKDNIKSSGSTGQVYSAIALLCIARISLIEQEQSSKKRKGVRFMPIDEAEGLGSNYEMLSNIAKSEDYQIISMSINPVGEFEQGSHYIYMLNEPEDEEIRINGIPFAQFTGEGIMANVQELISSGYYG